MSSNVVEDAMNLDNVAEKEEAAAPPTTTDQVAAAFQKYAAAEQEMTKEEHVLLDQFPIRSLTIPLPRNMGEVYLNPVTSLLGIAFLWGLAIWCMVDEDGSKAILKDWQAAVTEKFTWFYIFSNPAFTFFIFYLAYRYGDVKLGKDDEEPEFSDQAYFMMLFSAGVAVGLFFFGVSEPLYHRSDNWFAEAGYQSQDEIDQWALMITMYHWGFAGWSPYLVVAIAAGIAAYRFNLPMTVRSCLYELLGPYTWGWMGDVIDGFSMVTTVAGICTSLGLGSMQIITGAQRLGWTDTDLSEDEMTTKNVIVIWVITAFATLSVVTGLKVGIKLLSQLGFGLGMVLLFLCLVMEKTNYLFNLLVQTIGYFFQYCIFLVPFWTDAFGQLEEGEGRATDDNSAHPLWMNWWTVFYMSWWTAWGAFVGLFIARISRGRTIRQVVVYSFFAPLIYSFLWFCTFGGIGLRQARQAEELEVLGVLTDGDNSTHRVEGSLFCYNVPQDDVVHDGKVVWKNTLPGITPVCKFDPDDSEQAWFNVMYSFSYPDSDGFGGFGGFMAGLSLVAISVYFITSSDSGSLVVDHLASNGHEHHHWIQRVFWAFTEGAVATALLVAGGSDALSALQAASIVFGLPFNLFLYGMMYCTVKMCQMSEAETQAGISSERHELPPPEENSFAMPLYGGIFNIFEYAASLGRVHEERVARGMDKPTSSQTIEFVIGLFVPFLSLYKICKKLDYSPVSNLMLTAAYALGHIGWISFMASAAVNMGFVAFGFTLFFVNACILSSVRAEIREKFALDGNVIGDFLAGSFFYPQCLTQLLEEFKAQENKPTKAEKFEGKGDSASEVYY